MPVLVCLSLAFETGWALACGWRGPGRGRGWRAGLFGVNWAASWWFALSAPRSWKGNQWIWVTSGCVKETVGLTRILLPNAGAQGSGLGTLLIRPSPSLLSFLLPFLPLLRSHRCQGALGRHVSLLFGLCFLDSRGLQKSRRAGEAGLHPDPGSECPWAGYGMVLSLSFLICEMGKVAPLLWSIQIL